MYYVIVMKIIAYYFFPLDFYRFFSFRLNVVIYRYVLFFFYHNALKTFSTSGKKSCWTKKKKQQRCQFTKTRADCVPREHRRDSCRICIDFRLSKLDDGPRPDFGNVTKSPRICSFVQLNNNSGFGFSISPTKFRERFPSEYFTYHRFCSDIRIRVPQVFAGWLLENRKTVRYPAARAVVT